MQHILFRARPSHNIISKASQKAPNNGSVSNFFVIVLFINKKNLSFPLLSIFPYNRAICRTWDIEKRIVPVNDIYKQKPTPLLLMLEYLSAVFLGFVFFSFVKQCQNVSQHHHYIIEKECRKYGPAHFK